MTTIQIQKHIKRLVSESYEGSYDVRVNKLIDEVDLPVISIVESPISTMRLDESTIQRLESLKLYSTESYESVIIRLLLAKGLYTDEM